METNDWLDDVLYRTIPSLDLAMLYRQKTQAEQELHDFSAAFEKRMRRLLRKERRKWRTKNLVPVLVMILLALTATVALAANFKKIVRRFHWYDEKYGADCYDYKSNQQMETDDVIWIYPSYMPSGYELTEEDKKEQFGRLSLEYNNETGANISYDMWIFGNRTIYLDAEYDSSETVEINGMSWFVTWRDERYRMARAQKGDVLYLVNTPPELPREELIKILEGIIPVDRDVEEMNVEVENPSDTEETLSSDGQKIKDAAEAFVATYFNQDAEEIQTLLSDPFEWDIEVYSGTGTISEVSFKGLTDIGEEENGSVQVVSVEFTDSDAGDSCRYLTLEFVKQKNEWRIQFYGIEG